MHKISLKIYSSKIQWQPDLPPMPKKPILQQNSTYDYSLHLILPNLEAHYPWPTYKGIQHKMIQWVLEIKNKYWCNDICDLWWSKILCSILRELKLACRFIRSSESSGVRCLGAEGIIVNLILLELSIKWSKWDCSFFQGQRWLVGCLWFEMTSSIPKIIQIINFFYLHSQLNLYMIPEQPIV